MYSANFKKITSWSLVALGIILIILTYIVYKHPVMDFDISISKELQAEGDTPFKRILIYNILAAVSYIGRTTVAVWVVLAFSFLFWLLKYYWENLFCMLTLFSAVINSIVKFLIHRPRPTDSLINVLDQEMTPSYPSGHVVFYTVFFGYLIVAMFFTPKIPKIIRIIIGLISFTLIILVSISRIYLGAHWVTDVVAGYLVGIILLGILLYFYLKNYLGPKS